jgi:hypothetical protein
MIKLDQSHCLLIRNFINLSSIVTQVKLIVSLTYLKAVKSKTMLSKNDKVQGFLIGSLILMHINLVSFQLMKRTRVL